MPDLKIGNAEKKTSAIKIFDIPGDHHFSQNHTEYWAYSELFCTSLSIAKNHPVGIELAWFIKDGVPADKLQEFIEEVTATHLDAKSMIQVLRDQYADGYQKGKDDMRNEFRSLLGL
jgi:hypothetical protein